MLLVSTNIHEINKVKKSLTSKLEMKYLGEARKILHKYGMSVAKPISVPLGIQFKLSSTQLPRDENERTYMNRVPYASMARSLS